MAGLLFCKCKKEIANKEVIKDIQMEINRLKYV